MTESAWRRERRKLKKENRSLRRENAYLRHRAAMLGDRATAENGDATLLARQNATLAGARSLGDYLMLSLRMRRAFRFYDRTSFAVRQVFFFSKLWRLSRHLVGWLGFGVQLLFAVGLFAVLLPAILLLGAAFSLGYLLTARRQIGTLAREISGKEVVIFFYPAYPPVGAYGARVAAGFPPETVVLLISRSLRACGFSGIKRLSPRVFRVHIFSYYRLLRSLGAARRVMKFT